MIISVSILPQCLIEALRGRDSNSEDYSDVDDYYVTNRPEPFNNNIGPCTYNLHDLPAIPFSQH